MSPRLDADLLIAVADMDPFHAVAALHYFKHTALGGMR